MRSAFLLGILLLPLPTSGADWMSHGQLEPDTPYDLGPFMFEDAPEEGGSRVYFNAYPTASGTANPNSALLGSRLRPGAHVRWEAVLGLWTDCDRDGAIGSFATGLSEYPASLLLDESRCPAGSLHHDGTVVRELVAIGRGSGAPLRDDATRVWGDRGAPGTAGYEACRVLPLPRGTTSNTGRLLRALDCATEHRLIGAVNTVDNDGSLGLAIADPHQPERSRSLLVRDLPVSLFGNPLNGQRGLLEDDAPPTFTAWDCDGGGAAWPQLSDTPTSSSAWEAADVLVRDASGGCGSDDDSALAYAYVQAEAPFEPTSHSGRDQNDLVLVFEAGHSPRLTLEPWAASHSSAQGPTTAAPARWRATTDLAGLPPLLDRGTLRPSGAAHWTFYASVGETTLARGLQFPGGSGVYASEACGSHTSGLRNGWRCDPDAWWRDIGGDTMPRDASGRAWGARPGDAYQLRDVDCEDGELVRGMGLFASLAQLAAQTCGEASA
ncbi:MAG TPA: hypothetical protein VFH78_02605 [Candidatus Thermoplasmatota archaeon]|nr:hypothetical protein [Candidatus Thermoplasmatota archaeon]